MHFQQHLYSQLYTYVNLFPIVFLKCIPNSISQLYFQVYFLSRLGAGWPQPPHGPAPLFVPSGEKTAQPDLIILPFQPLFSQHRRRHKLWEKLKNHKLFLLWRLLILQWKTFHHTFSGFPIFPILNRYWFSLPFNIGLLRKKGELHKKKQGKIVRGRRH